MIRILSIFLIGCFAFFSTLIFINCASVIMPNGCGPKGFPINNELFRRGESILIQCCNQHDICYGSCLGKAYCDDQFEACLLMECNLLPNEQVHKCDTDARLMSSMVKIFGGPFYCTHRNK